MTMIPTPSIHEVRRLCSVIDERLRTKHILPFSGVEGAVFFISSAYPGAWMEHVFDAQAWTLLHGEDPYLPIRQTKIYLDHQKEDGQLPFSYFDKRYGANRDGARYNQIQECVSFASLCLEAYGFAKDRAYLAYAYKRLCRWDGWMTHKRMQTGRGLVEMFCGYDTGHDNSERLRGMKYPRNICEDGGFMPTDCPVAPLLASDMNACFFSNRIALSQMAALLDKPEESARWKAKAEAIREKMMELLFDEKDCFFYDRDKNGNLRRIKSIAVTNVICEDVCSPELANEIYDRHLANPDEFAAPYPFPGLALSEPRTAPHLKGNDWGYWSQGNTALRTLRWMKRYGREKELHLLMERWIAAWTAAADGNTPFGQELDPYTGIPSTASAWYSTTMLFYLHAARELELL